MSAVVRGREYRRVLDRDAGERGRVRGTVPDALAKAEAALADATLCHKAVTEELIDFLLEPCANP